MAITAYIEDGTGTGNTAKVSPEGFLYTQEAPYPPVETETKVTLYREFLTLNNNGTTTDMRVNGSVTPADFWIQGEPKYDVYITTISFLIAGPNATLNTFGAITALTNGCRFYYDDDNGEINIGTALQRNFDFVRLCQGNPSFGATTSAFVASNVVGTSEAVIPIFDFRNFGFKWGLKLRAGSLDKLALAVNDNLSPVAGLTGFNAVAYGFRRLI